jgi:betaine-aldehyde dehydrogenase
VDGSVLASLPDQGAAEVRAAVARLRRNQPAWEALGPTGRGEWAGRLRDWLFDNDERIAELFQRETGKPWREATLEVPFAIDLLEYYRRRAEGFLADSHPRPHDLLTASKKLTIAYRPYPVVGVICPWNNPILLALGDALPALLAGAAVAIKPSELTPLATREIVRGWCEDLGAPEVIECLTGAGATGAALVDEADYIQFTGSTRSGRKIAQRAAERLIPYSLELGGKDAMIVLADADVERAANAAVWGGMFNRARHAPPLSASTSRRRCTTSSSSWWPSACAACASAPAARASTPTSGRCPAKPSSTSSSGTCPRHWRRAHAPSSAASARTSREHISSRRCS